jgi:uncharacterized protein (TIGR03437 family)
MLLAGGALLVAVALAEIPNTTSAGIPLFRTDGSAIQMLVNNSFKAGATNSDGRVVITSSSDPLKAIAAAAAEWSGIGGALVNFLPAQSTTLSNDPSDGNFVLTIQDTAENRSIVGGYLAMTMYSYSLSGAITDSDVIFSPSVIQNGVFYPFSTDHESSSYDLQSLVAHELGHSLGSSHSPVIGATMFQSQGAFSPYITVAEATAHQALSPDDIAFATTRYPAPGAQAQVGSISGTVAFTSGSPVLGALIVALDPTTGITIGGLSSLSDGTYLLPSVPPGTYSVYAQPANGPVMVSNLSGVPNMSKANASFRVTFAGGNATPSAIALSAGQAATADIGVDPSSPGMQVAILGTGSAGGSDWDYSGGVESAAAGSSLDLLLWGQGLSSAVTESQIRLLGPGIKLRSGTLRAGGVNNGMTARRFTVDLAPAVATAPVTIAVVNGTDAAVYSGGFVILGSGAVCTSTVSSKLFSMPLAGGSGAVTVTAGASCPWTAASGASWLHVTSAASASGNGAVSFAADSNAGTTRSGTLAIAGQSVVVTQAGCAATLSPQQLSLLAAGGSGMVAVAAGSACSWTAASGTSWLHVTSAALGSGNGSVSFAADPNAGTAARSGTLAIAGQSAAVTQAGAPVAISSVVNGASFLPGIEAGSWVTIKGTNLANTNPGRSWRSDEIVGGKLPAWLDGVSVTIDGKPASVYYISPAQINVQAPSDTATGAVSVVVTNNGAASAAATAQLQAFAPAVFQYLPTSYAIATRYPDNALVANPSAIAGTVAAAPGDVLILWATGFGPTNPATPAGQVVTGAPAVTTLPTVTVGGLPATVIGAALSPGSAGLYQIAIQIPAAVASGDAAIRATAGGFTSPAGVNVFVK